MDIYLFSQFLAYRIGGAEESLIQLAQQKHDPSSDTFHIVSFKELAQHQVVPQELIPAQHERIHFLQATFSFSFFPYMNAWLNQKSSQPYFDNQKDGILYASSIHAPNTLLVFEGEKYFYIQSEIALGIPWNHETGIRRLFKHIYNGLESPFRYWYRKQVKKALRASKVICCSEFIAKQTKRLYGIEDIEIVHPPIDYAQLQLDYQQRKNNVPNKGIVYVGDAAYKGLGIAKALVQKLPHQTFHFFSKRVENTQTIGNLHIHPWQRNIADVYTYAELVIMPSFCKESFGRVAREAYSLGIPVLVSNHGGLPEAVYHDEKMLINDFKNVNAWITSIQSILGT